MVAQVPVLVVLRTELNAAATVANGPITAKFTAGAQMHADARIGAHWESGQDQWEPILGADWSYQYWAPEWEFEQNNASPLSTLCFVVAHSLSHNVV